MHLNPAGINQVSAYFISLWIFSFTLKYITAKVKCVERMRFHVVFTNKANSQNTAKHNQDDSLAV